MRDHLISGFTVTGQAAFLSVPVILTVINVIKVEEREPGEGTTVHALTK